MHRQCEGMFMVKLSHHQCWFGKYSLYLESWLCCFIAKYQQTTLSSLYLVPQLWRKKGDTSKNFPLAVTFKNTSKYLDCSSRFVYSVVSI